MNAVLAVFIGGGLGSVARYGITNYSLKMIQSGFPWGTFVSNMLACLLLALSVIFLKEKFVEQPMWRFFIVTGFCGGFSTFSTFSFENYVLFRTDHLYLALVNALVSVVVGFLIMVLLFKDFHFEA